MKVLSAKSTFNYKHSCFTLKTPCAALCNVGFISTISSNYNPAPLGTHYSDTKRNLHFCFIQGLVKDSLLSFHLNSSSFILFNALLMCVFIYHYYQGLFSLQLIFTPPLPTTLQSDPILLLIISVF